MFAQNSPFAPANITVPEQRYPERSFFDNWGRHLPSLPNGLVERLGGFRNGAWSIARGNYRLGLYSHKYLTMSDEEIMYRELEISFALNMAAAYPKETAAYIGGGLSEFTDSDYGKGYMFGRALFGILSFGGPSATLGDAMHAMENGHQKTVEELGLQAIIGE